VAGMSVLQHAALWRAVLDVLACVCVNC